MNEYSLAKVQLFYLTFASSLTLCRQGVQGVQDITCHPCIFRVLEDSVLTDICLELPRTP